MRQFLIQVAAWFIGFCVPFCILIWALMGNEAIKRMYRMGRQKYPVTLPQERVTQLEAELAELRREFQEKEQAFTESMQKKMEKNA